MTLIRLNCPASSITGWTRARGGLLRPSSKLRRGGVKHGIRPGGRQKFRERHHAVCAKNPGKTLDGILEEVQYDVPEGGSEPRCSDLDGMTETEDLAQLLLWTQGYLESELSENEEAIDQAIHQDMFREDVAEVLAQCKGGGSDAKLIDVMRKVIMGEE